MKSYAKLSYYVILQWETFNKQVDSFRKFDAHKTCWIRGKGLQRFVEPKKLERGREGSLSECSDKIARGEKQFNANWGQAIWKRIRPADAKQFFKTFQGFLVQCI